MWGHPRHTICSVADQFPATGLRSGRSRPQAGSTECRRAPNRILNAEHFRDRRFAASLANVTAPDCDIVCDPKHHSHVGRIRRHAAAWAWARAVALLSIGWRSFFQIQDQRQNSAYHKHDRDQQHCRLPGCQLLSVSGQRRPTTQLVGLSEALGQSIGAAA